MPLCVCCGKIFCGLALLLCSGGAFADAIDSRATQLLQRMTGAYTHLRFLEQRTEFRSALIPFKAPDTPFGTPQKPDEKPEAPADREKSKADGAKSKTESAEIKLEHSLHLWYAGPNRLRLELEEPNGTDKPPTKQQWVSDGTYFWTTIPEKNWYTRDKAPKQITDFSKLERMNSGSLEMLMLMGINPFEKVKEQVDRVTWDGEASVGDVVTDVVTLWADSRVQETRATLYIGHEDLLLRRVVVETTPVAAPMVPGKVGDPLDELADDDPNSAPVPQADSTETEPSLLDAPLPPPAQTPMRTRVTYDNIVETDGNFNFNLFTFTIPLNAWRYGVDAEPKGKKKKKSPLLMKRHKIPDYLKH